MNLDVIIENLVTAYKLRDSVLPSLRILLELLIKNTDEETATNVLNDFVYDFIESLNSEFYGED